MKVTRAVKRASGTLPLLIEFVQRGTVPLWTTDEEWDAVYGEGYLHGWEARGEVILTFLTYLYTN